MLKIGKGFTLLEIMIVIVVLGIIAAFGIPNYERSLEKADEKEGQFNLEVISAAMESYELRNGNYPTVNLDTITDINAMLNLGIIEANMVYDCDTAALPTGYTCTATSTYGWALAITAPDNGVVGCSVPACPTL